MKYLRTAKTEQRLPIMSKIYIVPIEPIDTRYTKQWYENIPKTLTSIYGIVPVVIEGEQVSSGTTAGAFLDFAATNVYKSSQINAIAKLFNDGKINPGDKFLVTDAWNYAIIAIKYMSDLLDIPVEIHGIWHAGAYDPTDILGKKMAKPYPYHFERAIFYACDFNYFATEYHALMFMDNLKIPHDDFSERFEISGQPHDLVVEPLINLGRTTNKENNILFPHRIDGDKQPDIFKDMVTSNLLNGKGIITLDVCPDKPSYYELMAKSKIVFSCALQENLGIAMMEACLLGAIPIVPDRASYAEMYLPAFKYPSEWTESYESYRKHRFELIDFVNDKLMNFEQYEELIDIQRVRIFSLYMTGDIMFNNLVLGVDE